MRYVDLNGDPIEVSISNKLLYNKKTHFSKLHQYAKNLVEKLYPRFCLYEDVPVRVYPDKLLYIDIFLIELNIAIEVHGRQHYEFIPHFHKNKLDFLKRKQDDVFKKQWCENNKIRYVELPYNENREQWEKRINGN